MALRWAAADPRSAVVAIAPYAGFQCRHEHPRPIRSLAAQILVNAGLKELPSVLGVPASELDTTTVLARHPVTALFVTDAGDKIVPLADVEHLRALAAGDSELIVVPDATHETVTYYMADLTSPVLNWLSDKTEKTINPAGRSQIPDAAGHKCRPAATDSRACRARRSGPDPAPAPDRPCGSCSSDGRR